MSLEEIIDENLISEILRLKKIISYFSNIVNLIDPEISDPKQYPGIIDIFRDCDTHLLNYNANKNTQHLVRVNDNLTNLIPTIKNLSLISEDVIERAEILSEYNKTVTKHLENMKNTKEIYDRAVSLEKKIMGFHEKILGKNDGNRSIEMIVNKIVDDAQKKYEEICDYYNKTLIDEGKTLSTKSEINEAKKDILRDAEEVSKKLIDVSKKIDNLDKFYIETFGEISESNKSDKKIDNNGLKNKLIEYEKEFDNFYDESKSKVKKLNEEIEKNIQGSTTLGLALSFQELKKSFENPILLWNSVFIAAISVIFYVSYKIQTSIEVSKVFYEKITLIFPIVLPLIWLAMIAGKRRNESNRLKQEYAHKEVVAKTYMNYKKQIEELDEEGKDLMLKLLENTIASVAFNASTTLDKKHGEKTPYHELLELMCKLGKEAGSKLDENKKDKDK